MATRYMHNLVKPLDPQKKWVKGNLIDIRVNG
jgi:hypothetical protein